MNDSFMKIVSFELKRIRETNNYTLSQVSKVTGYSKPLLSRYENGKPIDLKIFLNLLDFYNVRADIFFEKVYAYAYTKEN